MYRAATTACHKSNRTTRRVEPQSAAGFAGGHDTPTGGQTVSDIFRDPAFAIHQRETAGYQPCGFNTMPASGGTVTFIE